MPKSKITPLFKMAASVVLLLVLDQTASAQTTPTDSTAPPVDTTQADTLMLDKADIAKPLPDTLIFGDSVAKGMLSATESDGDAVGGRNPKQILDAIKAYDADSTQCPLRGAVVILTAGTGNAGGYVGKDVRAQLQYLKDAGVKEVVLMGVSDKRTDFDPTKTNKKLKALAEEFGFVYGGPVRNAGSDGIHPPNPKEYKKTYQQAINAIKVKKP